jgi:hypothetical protein
LIARLFDSVAPEVKTISFGPWRRSERHLLARDLTASSASQPKAWLRLAALPNFS